MPDEIVPSNSEPRQLSFFDLTTNETPFDAIKHIDENGQEYWLTRELMPILQYTNWQNFHKVIKKAKTACKRSKNDTSRHFIDVGKIIDLGDGLQHEIDDYREKTA